MILLNLGLAPQQVNGQIDLSQGQTSRLDSTQVVIALADGTNVDQVAAQYGAEVVHQGPLNYATLELTTNTNLPQVLDELKRTPGIISAEVNQRRTIADLPVPSVPKDPLFQKQWSMVSGNVQGAWDLGATGLGVTIAIVDSGVALDHLDLKDNLVPGYNAITKSEAPGATQDDNGHGTHVSGIAAAGRNGVGIVGVAYKAKIMPIKAMNAKGEGYDDVIADGIVWATDHGAKIINLSIGSESGLSSAILNSAINYAYDGGCLLVGAAGNYAPQTEVNPGVSYPASDPHVLAIVATDRTSKVTGYSETGSEIDLAAPGDYIASTWWSKTEGSDYGYASGTSMAAPFVSGEAALLWSQHLGWSPEQVAEALKQGTQDLGAPGRDNQYGDGLVDVKLALTIASKAAETLTSSINALGGVVQTVKGRTQVSLTIAPKTFEQAVDVSLITITAPASLPKGATFLTPTFQVGWGKALPQKMLSLKWHDPLLKVDSGATVYRWKGERWLALGGEIISGEVRLGLYSPGIYAIGTPQVTTQQSQRFAGNTAEGTAVQISKATFPTGADTVLLAQVSQFPDALAGAPLAYKLQAPILLSPSSGLTEEVRAEIQRVAPKTIYLLGGTAALSSNIETELRQKYEIKRLSGFTAEGTAVEIARELGTKGRAVVASVRSFQDALVISAWAARQGIPILLTQSQALSADTQTVLKQLEVTESLVIGGTTVVGPKVMSQLPAPKRISGVSAYDTAAAVLQAFPPTTDKLLMATGENYPDALTGAVRAAFYGSMVVLVPTHSALPASLATLLKSWRGRQVEILGGVVALPENVVETINMYVQ